MRSASVKKLERCDMKFHPPMSRTLLMLFIFYSAAFGADRRRQAWITPQSIRSFVPAGAEDWSATLPAPRLIREPEFSFGTDNTVYWPADSLENAALADGRTLLFYEIQARYASPDSAITLWGFVDAGTDSALFTGLPEGPEIEYRLRYYARDAAGVFGLSFWSDSRISTQDAHLPLLGRWDIIRLQKATPIAWTIGKTLTFLVTASDPPAGKVMEMIVHEKSESADDTVIFDIIPPKNEVDTVFSTYTLRTPEHRPVTLTFWVRDLAGQSSSPLSETLFWMPEKENRMFSFPNPFNPSRQEIAVIQVPTSDLQTVRIYDPFGNCVRILHKADPSNAFFEWDGRNDRGDLVANGGYLCAAAGSSGLYCKIAVLR
jgi:hypothetical protein